MKTLTHMLETNFLAQDKQDSLIWTYSPNKRIAVKSFSLWLQKSFADVDQINLGATLAWKGLAPPHADLTAWFVFHQRLNTKDGLYRLKIIQPVKAICPFYKGEVEYINHLFFSCNVSWVLWSSMIKWWNFQWCCQIRVRLFYILKLKFYI